MVQVAEAEKHEGGGWSTFVGREGGGRLQAPSQGDGAGLPMGPLPVPTMEREGTQGHQAWNGVQIREGGAEKSAEAPDQLETATERKASLDQNPCMQPHQVWSMKSIHFFVFVLSSKSNNKTNFGAPIICAPAVPQSGLILLPLLHELLPSTSASYFGLGVLLNTDVVNINQAVFITKACSAGDYYICHNYSELSGFSYFKIKN